MVTQEQIYKAKIRALSQGVKVWMLEPSIRYVVPSRADDGTAYEVVVQSMKPGEITFTCKAGVNQRICLHIGAVLVRLQIEMEMPRPQDKDRLEQRIADLYH
jgi:hypothetical protein